VPAAMHLSTKALRSSLLVVDGPHFSRVFPELSLERRIGALEQPERRFCAPTVAGTLGKDTLSAAAGPQKIDGFRRHVFKGEGYDTPTDERHCVNSVSLKFKPGESAM
jgi:hypothetical protein